MSRLSWYINRIRAMSPIEIIARAQEHAAHLIKKRYYKRKPQSILTLSRLREEQLDPTNLGFQFTEDTFSSWKERFPQAQARMIALADEVCELSFKLLGDDTVRFDKDIRWFIGLPRRQKDWPIDYFTNIPYRNRDDIGEIRLTWELNRFAHLVPLAKAYAATKQPKYAEQLESILLHWIKHNPLFLTINYISNMEHAIRLHHLAWCFSFLAYGGASQSLLQLVLRLICSFSELIMRKLALHSSANNHLIIECCSVCIAYLLFPNYIPEKHYRTCLHLLNQELPRQFHPDGINAEQAIHYQAFVLEAVYMLLYTIKRKNQTPMEKACEKIVEQGTEYLACILNRELIAPHIGDSDDGRYLALGEENEYRTLLNLGAAYFNRPDFKWKTAERLDETCFWAAGLDKVTDWDRLTADSSKALTKSRTFAHGGMSILKHCDAQLETMMTFDHGPLGLGTLAAHGHADALSITLDINGIPVLIDPGTYIYNIESEYRDDFRATANHNTATINGNNQSQIRGPFLWGERAESEMLESRLSDAEDFVSAQHNGYRPVTHIRSVTYTKPQFWVIHDQFIGRYETGELTFNIPKDIPIYQSNTNQVELFVGSHQLILTFSSSSTMDTAIVPCWHSSRFSVRNEGVQIKVRLKSYANEVTTTLRLV